MKVELENKTWDFEESGSNLERTENKPGRNTLLSILFLGGQFGEILAHGLNQSKLLGWSGTFMKQGIAMFLLALHEGNGNGKGIQKMADMVKGAGTGLFPRAMSQVSCLHEQLYGECREG